MHSLVHTCLGLGILLSTSSSAIALEQPLSLLFFGNSYTQGYVPGQNGASDIFYNVPTAISNLAVADGHVAPTIVQELQGGQSLSYHVTKAQTNPQANVAAQVFDYVVLQDLSTRPADKVSTPAAIAQFRSDVKTLTDLTRQHSPDAGTILYDTWAKAPSSSYYPNPYVTPNAMQTDLDKNYGLATTDLNTKYGPSEARMAPVGAAFGALNFDPSLYAWDTTHSTALGYRLSAMVLYRTIYNEKVSDIPYSAVSSWIGLSQSQFAQIASVADSVVIPVPEPTAGLSMTAGIFLLLNRGRSDRRG